MKKSKKKIVIGGVILALIIAIVIIVVLISNGSKKEESKNNVANNNTVSSNITNNIENNSQANNNSTTNKETNNTASNNATSNITNNTSSSSTSNTTTNTSTNVESTSITSNNTTSNSIDFNGNYSYAQEGTGLYHRSNLTIKKQNENGIEFSINTTHGRDVDHVNIGELTGTAAKIEVPESSKIPESTQYAYQFKEEKDGKTNLITFVFTAHRNFKYVTISEKYPNESNPYAGAGVFFKGEYEKN